MGGAKRARATITALIPAEQSESRDPATPVLAVALGFLIAAFALASHSSAQAQTRVPTWCAYMGGQFGFDCGFYSFEQCMETARGLGNYCTPNPRAQAVPRVSRRARRVRNR